MDRESTKHSPRVDDQMVHETSGLLQGRTFDEGREEGFTQEAPEDPGAGRRAEVPIPNSPVAAPAITAKPANHYFRMMKELALLGYFTSEIGYTKAMRYVESPGRFDPCTPYTKGETDWASHA